MKIFTKICLPALCLFLGSCYVYKPYEVDEELPVEEQEIPPIEQQLQANKNYKVFTQDSMDYKVKMVKWEKDSAVFHLKGNENKEFKIAKKDIEEVKFRKFSFLKADGLTLLGYAGIIVGVILLL